jgi:hypothetical protein
VTNGSSRRWLSHSITAVIFLVVGLAVAQTDVGEQLRQSGRPIGFKAVAAPSRQGNLGDTRINLLLENPDVMDRIMKGGSFGGAFSRHVAQNGSGG